MSVQLADFASATNILGQYDCVGQQISPVGVLLSGIKAAVAVEIINMLHPTDLANFFLNTNAPSSMNMNTLNENIEGMALVPDLSTPAANGFSLFVGNDNDFQSFDVKVLIPAGNVVSRGDGRLTLGVTNDAMIYVWHLTIDAGDKKSSALGSGKLAHGANHRAFAGNREGRFCVFLKNSHKLYPCFIRRGLDGGVNSAAHHESNLPLYLLSRNLRTAVFQLSCRSEFVFFAVFSSDRKSRR